jgi:effector-binding domain-containing protein
MNYQIRIEQFPGQPTAVVRRQATKAQLSQVIPEACGTVWSALKSQGIRGGRHVAVYLDQAIKLEIGVEMTAPVTPFGEILSSSLPAGKVATTTHFGPYQNLGKAHDAIQQWCTANHHEMTMPCWETYGHWLDEWNNDPSKIRTDVYYILKT